MNNDPKILTEARKLVEEEIVGKKTSDFLMLSAEHRHFLFTTRMHVLNEKENPEEKPFRFTAKQLKFLKDLLASVKLDGGESKKIEEALSAAVRNVRKKTSEAISSELDKLEELGFENRKILRRKLEDLLS